MSFMTKALRNEQHVKALRYREMLDEQVIERRRMREREMLEGGGVHLGEDDDSWHHQLKSGISRRQGGGGEPLRRADGSVVANLRTLERTHNPNLPIPFDYDEQLMSMNRTPRVGIEVEEGSSPVSPSSKFVLHTHALSSPEEMESLVTRRRKQMELRSVLERQVQEKQRRREKERQEQLELELREEETLAVVKASLAVEKLGSGTVDGMQLHGSLSDGNKASSSSTSLKKFLSSPLHAFIDQQDAGVRDKAPPDEHSHEDVKDDLLAKNKDALLEKQSSLMETIERQSDEIRRLESQLDGVREGRQIFEGEMRADHVNPSSLSFAVSPIKLNRKIAPSKELPVSLESGPELQSDSQYVPLTSAPTMYNSSSITYGTTIPPPSMNVSTSMLQSSFGLTSFDKTFNKNQYENRREEALESFLYAFQSQQL